MMTEKVAATPAERPDPVTVPQNFSLPTSAQAYPAPVADTAEGDNPSREATSPYGDPWTTKFYPEGTPAFERVVLFSDGVFAISLTLMAAAVTVPVLRDSATPSEMFSALVDKQGPLFAFLLTATWVALYWKANHRFVTTLRGMSSHYITATLVYLVMIALLPFPTGTLGEHWNPVAVAFFLLYLAMVSAMETVLIGVAIKDDLYVRTLTRQERKRSVYSSLSPVAAGIIAAPIAFLPIGETPAMVLSLVTMSVVAVTLGAVVRRRYPVTL